MSNNKKYIIPFYYIIGANKIINFSKLIKNYFFNKIKIIFNN